MGAMAGLALGDALGMPTQSMSAKQIRRYYDGPITKLMNAVPQQPIAPNMKAGDMIFITAGMGGGSKGLYLAGVECVDNAEAPTIQNRLSYSHGDLSTITAALITPDTPTICCNGKLR